MERRTLVILILLAVLLSAALAWFTLSAARFWRPHNAAASMQREIRAVAPFDRLQLDGGAADVTLVQGSVPALAIESAAGFPVTTRVRNGKLTIDTGRREGWRSLFDRGPRVTPKITITFTDLRAIDATGAVKLRASAIRTPVLHIAVSGAGSVNLANLQTDAFSLEASGTVKAVVAGQASRQRVEISGAGNYQGANLASEAADVDVSGAGKVVVNASKMLRIDISGAGVVSYIGNPDVQKSISGFGKVRRLSNETGERAADAPGPAPDPTMEPQHREHVLIA